jgi:hypothetical protein
VFKFTRVTAVSAGLALAALAGGGIAAASVSYGGGNGCTNGPFAGECGDQWSTGTPSLGLSTFGDEVLATPRGGQMIWHADEGPNAANNDKEALGSQNGQPDGLAMTAAFGGRVVMAPDGNISNDPNQKWIAVGPETNGGYEWQNVGTGRILVILRHGKVGLESASSPVTDFNTFTFNEG